jgi:hypothetical protein
VALIGWWMVEHGAEGEVMRKVIVVALVAVAAGVRGEEGGRFSATFRAGELTGLVGASGETFVRQPAHPRGFAVHCTETTQWVEVEPNEAPKTVKPGQPVKSQYSRFRPPEKGLNPGEKGTATFECEVDGDTNDLVVRQEVRDARPGVWGVSWWIANVPLDYSVLVPGNSGMCLTADTPDSEHQFEYPISWEAQFVVIAGKSGGFYVWAQDIAGRYKRLIVERNAEGWRLGFITINDAPFDSLTNCQSVTWRLNTYDGDWRVAARRYRDWMQANLHPTSIADQQPSWVSQIRGCVVMGLDRAVLELLPRQFDARQTLLYLYDWRQAGYDRNYPDYDQQRPQLDPFVKRAHELGFRVMLHVNYFGLDPLHPRYKDFERYQVRDAFGSHERQWWVWPPESPDIRFAYINPAFKGWRDLFTDAMTQLCRRTGADALHLDQTLCIYNDHNGRIDGMSMLEGNLALHRQLREALPQVALSGEGLNEITCRYEAFAQRHVWGLDHSKGTYDRARLAAAHPISSYILRPYTVMYGYLGCAPPDSGQLYAAWNEAYRRWGVIPTLKPSVATIESPTGFARQFFDELKFWQSRRVELDWDRSSTTGTDVSLRTSDGAEATYTADRRLTCGAKDISRTVTDATEIQGTGTIPDWRVFDDRRLFGLRPKNWYPYFPEPRDQNQPHIASLPDSLSIGSFAIADDITVIQTLDAAPLIADLPTLLTHATCGSRPAQGTPQEAPGPWQSPDGSNFTAFDTMFSAHPPWKVPGSGEVFARFKIRIPSQGVARFLSEVAIDAASVGPDKSDGVTFSVVARDGQRQQAAKTHNASATPQPLELDLAEFRGREITLELAVGPGPKNAPSYDWARWRNPRVERQLRQQGQLTLIHAPRSTMAIGPSGPSPLTTDSQQATFRTELPGKVFLLREPPQPISCPLQLADLRPRALYTDDSGSSTATRLYARFEPGTNTVGKTPRAGFFAHPPDQGQTAALFPMQLPPDPARFHAWVGLRDGSKSDGVVFSVEVNGETRATLRVQPGSWHELDADLSGQAGQPIVLGLITDSAGTFQFDWAAWGQPSLEPATSKQR